METLTIQRRTISLPAKEVKCKLKWTDRQRTPRKLKKKLKKKLGHEWMFSKCFTNVVFVEGSPSRGYKNLYCKGIEEYGK